MGWRKIPAETTSGLATSFGLEMRETYGVREACFRFPSALLFEIAGAHALQ